LLERGRCAGYGKATFSLAKREQMVACGCSRGDGVAEVLMDTDYNTVAGYGKIFLAKRIGTDVNTVAETKEWKDLPFNRLQGWI
jgi:hypothetical protein